MKDSWERKRISEFAEVISGGTPSTSVEEFWNGDVVWITPSDLSKMKYPKIDSSIKKITDLGLNNSSANLIPARSIVMSSRAPIGYFAIPTIDFSTNQGCKSIKLDNQQDELFHYYNFLFNVETFKKKGEGTTFAEISKKEIEKLVFKFPPLPQQRKIAEILSTVDTVLEKTEAAIAKYQQLKLGLMLDVFTRGIDVHTGQLRPKQTEAPELYKQSALGWIPQEWEVMRMGDILKITTGGRDTQDRVENGKYPFYVRSQNIERINSYSFDGVGILTAGDGVGTGKVFHFVNGKIDFHQRVYLLYDFEENIIPEYVFEYFKLNFIHRVEKFSAKNTVDSVRLEMISDMLIPISIEQNKISIILNNLNQKIHTEQQALAKYQQLKAGLLQDLLTGKVEVSVP